MPLADLFDEGREKELLALCMNYYTYANEYYSKKLEPPPKEMAQKLRLHIEEYSELLIFLNDGGYDMLVKSQISADFQNGATFIDDPLTNIR